MTTPAAEHQAGRADEFKMLQVRLPKKMVRFLDHLAVDTDQNRTQLVDTLLREGLKALGYCYAD